VSWVSGFSVYVFGGAGNGGGRSGFECSSASFKIGGGGLRPLGPFPHADLSSLLNLRFDVRSSSFLPRFVVEFELDAGSTDDFFLSTLFLVLQVSPG